MRLVPLPRRAPRTLLATTSILLILSGVFAGDYAMEPGSIWSLALYIICLGTSAFAIAKVDLVPTHRLETKAVSSSQTRPDANTIGETASAAGVAETAFRPKRNSQLKPSSMLQQSLDLDGMGALRSLEQITGQWLVCDASEPAAKLIRSVCLQRIEGDDSDQERAERWFEIAHGLRSRECRSLPKAELRRSFVAEKVGVSKEQVRQIDQGRYAPLNKLLDEIDPKSL